MDQITQEEKAELEQLRADKARREKITFKVSQKGAVSIYGMGRFPVTLYREQWNRILAKATDLQQFITDHGDELASKDKPLKIA